MRQTSFFSHDSNASNDPKILVLLAELGLEGYGIYWTVIEHLREQPNYVSRLDVLKGLAMRFGSSREKYQAVVMKYELFRVQDDLFFYSESLRDRMSKYDLIIESKRKAGIASGKSRQLNARQLSIESNTCSTIKLKETKEKEILSNTFRLEQEVLKHLFEAKKTVLKGSKPFTVTPSRKRLISKRVKEGHGIKQFRAVIDYKVKDWIHDMDMRKYLCPETLFSDKFDKYLDQARDDYANGKEVNPYKT